MVLPPLFFWWLTTGLAWPAQAVWRATGIALGFLGLMPLALVAYMVLRGPARTLEVRDRALRTPAFVASVGMGLAAVIVAARLQWPEAGIIPALLLVFPLNSALLGVINLKTKISVHCASVAAFAVMGLWMAVAAGLSVRPVVIAAIALPLVMWARVTDEAHSVRQVILGAIFGLLVPLAELYALTAVGWLRIP